MARSRAERALTPAAAEVAGVSLADVVDGLIEEFRDSLGRATVVMVCRRCRRELEILEGPTPPWIVAELARERLADLAAARSPHAMTG